MAQTRILADDRRDDPDPLGDVVQREAQN